MQKVNFAYVVRYIYLYEFVDPQSKSEPTANYIIMV